MNKKLILILSLLTVYFFDIANPDALRQGTEGFYLQISKEMKEAGNIITPIIYGEPHWSKPPLHFLFPRLISFISSDYLFTARLSIALLSIFLITLISYWYEDNLKRNWYEAFIFLVTPIYFFKYSRIFMMEMPLALLTTLGYLHFFTYINSNNNKKLITGTIITALSVLIKGPVSLFLIGPGCFIYTIYYKKPFKKFLIYFTLAFLLSSIWFIVCSFVHGLEFFNYFFIRENVGKFQSKSYPITSVIQGLIIFSLPVVFYIPSLVKNFGMKLFKNQQTNFLVLNFIFLYFIWFIPKQRSHHYAVPAIPTLLLFSSYYFFNLRETLQIHLIRKVNNILSLFVFFLIGLVLLGYKLSIIGLDQSTYLFGALFILSIWFSRKIFFDRFSELTKPFLFLALLWNFIAPLFYLPMLPSTVKEQINRHQRGVLNIRFRKPFFIEQQVTINSKILRKNQSDYGSLQSGDLLLAPSLEIDQYLNKKHSDIATWQTWKRGAKFDLIRKALSSGKIALIQQQYKLIEID